MVIKDLGQLSYQDVLVKMQHFTQERLATTPDEIWLCEHPPVFTLGRHGDPSHIFDTHEIPVVLTDRGGQVTYHGPGQLLIYCLFDLKRGKLGVAQFVCKLEGIIIKVLEEFGLHAMRRKGMPGVYVDSAKICSIGLRVQHGCAYHGLALNIDMDLTPFSYINPCGYQNLAVTQVAALVPGVTFLQVKHNVLDHFKSLS